MSTENTKLSLISEELIPPTPPEEWECCGNDCGEACVYSIYNKAKAEYEQQKKLLEDFNDE